MSLNHKMEKILKTKKNLEDKLIKEGLTKKEKQILDEIKTNLTEAPIDYSNVGGARMEPERQRKFESGENPYVKYGMSQELLDILGSEAFKTSVEKVKRALGECPQISSTF